MSSNRQNKVMVRTNVLPIIILFVVFHGILLVHDFAHPDAFLTGDRSISRYEKIQYFLYGSTGQIAFEHLELREGERSVAERILEMGSPGDYVLHAALFGIGGRLFIILFHLALALVSVLCVYRLALLLGQPQRFARIAAAVYIVLPGSLMQPHQLVTEGIFTPLVVIAFYLIIRSVEEEFRRGLFMAALSILALIIFVRFQFIFYPILLAVILGWSLYPRWLETTVPILLICFLGPLIWMGFVYGHTGEFTMGASDHSVALNFLIRAERIADAGGFEFDASIYANREMPTDAFLSLVLNHPLAYLQTVVANAANVLFNPGINAFAGHYLGLFDTEHVTFWRELLDRSGPLHVVEEVSRRSGGFAALFFVSVLIWGAICAFSVIGAVTWLRSDRSRTATKAVLMSYLAYAFLSVLVIGGTRWTHRPPFEFVIVILFAFGIERMSGRRGSA